MTYLFAAGSVFAILLIATVLRDLARVSVTLATVTLAYVVGMGWLSVRGYFLASAETLPPVGLIAGQLFLALLVASVFIIGAEAWRAIPVERFFLWHSFRLPMGIIMVLLSYFGELAPEFGWGAGLGEIVVGCWALVYVLLSSSPTPQSIIVWCGIGLLDVLVGMVTAVLTFRSPAQYFPHASQMRIMSTIPMVLIPSFSMAVLTLSTVLVFFRRIEVREARLRAGEFTPGKTV